MDTVDWRFIIIDMSQDACEAARLGLDAERSSRLRALFDGSEGLHVLVCVLNSIPVLCRRRLRPPPRSPALAA